MRPVPIVVLAAALLACAHEARVSDELPQAPPPESAFHRGDSLAQVSRQLGGHGDVRMISPSEKVLTALYPVPCPDVPGRSADLSRPPCAAARLLTLRFLDDRLISFEWGDPPADPPRAAPLPPVSAPPAP